jgi:acetyltransferase-like isoleucine patch superfamily enzyme
MTIKEIIKQGLKQTLHTMARNLPVGRLRPYFYKMMGVKIKGKVMIEGNVWIDELAPEKITIEEDVAIAPGVIIVAHEGASMLLRRFSYPFKTESVLIKKGAWIGAGAIILPGIKIGEGSVVGAGAVVIHDVPNYTLVAGVPAQIIKDIRNEK